LSLLNLAPDLQEHLLFLQRPARGRQSLRGGSGGRGGYGGGGRRY
jgi:hypothetical protein